MNGLVSEGVLAALAWLDALCAQAAQAARLVYAAPDDPYRGLYVSEDDLQRILSREPGAPVFGAVESAASFPLAELPPFDHLARRFGLSDFDLKTLLIASATALDSRYERLYAYLQDDVTRKQPTIDLALNLLCSTLGEKLARRAHFTPAAPLIRHGLVRLMADPSAIEPPALTQFLKVDDSVVNWLLGLDSDDATEALPLDDLLLNDDLRHALERLILQGEPLRLYFDGEPGTGKRQAAEAVAGELGRALLPVDAPDDASLVAAFRQASLSGKALYLTGVSASEVFARLLADHDGTVIAAGTSPLPGMIALHFTRPDFRLRRAAWQDALAAEHIRLSAADLDRVASLKLTGGEIRASARQALDQARRVEGRDPQLTDYFAAAGAQTGHELAALAQRITPVYGWDDIVLPDDVIAQLAELCARVEGGQRVLDDWGFRGKLSQGRGVTALFAGPSGTGKTMASEIIAQHLHLDLYRIDLAGVVSKYIGETEKNLDRIFGAAEHANAILLFDEADALFGKRSEVRDSHDRYANLEISYLLQKMEQFDGAAILTTNLRGNLDDAFTRRLAFTVYFPFPDAEQRRRIWDGIWPQAAPLDRDADLDTLARQFKLSGGSIRNIALGAAFLAASDGGVIRMEHLLRATQREYQKMGKLLTETELAGGVLT